MHRDLLREQLIRRMPSRGRRWPSSSRSEAEAAALAEIRRGQRIDLMLTDIILPGGMDGTELVERVARSKLEMC